MELNEALMGGRARESIPRLSPYHGNIAEDRPARHRVAEAGVPGGHVGDGATALWSRIPMTADEDAKRLIRERECLVGRRTRLANRMKATWLGIGHSQFQPTPRKAANRLEQYTSRRASRYR